METQCIREELRYCLQNIDLQQFKQTLSQSPILIHQIQGRDGSNLFHLIANCSTRQKVLLQFTDLTIPFLQQATLITMLNTQTRPAGQTPLHYAVRHNRRFLVKKFLNLGANPFICDKNKQNLLHVSSMLGFTALAVYFHIDFRMDLQSIDLNGRTPLHLSALEAQELVSIYLLSKMRNLNIRDNQNLTPLHLAAYSANYRIARHLILKGADKNVQTPEGICPLKVAQVKQSLDLVKILVSFIQKQPSWLEKINFFKPTIGPKQSFKKLRGLYFFMVMCRAFMLIGFVLPFLNLIFGVFCLLLLSLTLILFLATGNSDPGYVKKSVKRKILVIFKQFIYEKYKPQFVCPYCQEKKPKFSRHCPHCNRCVRKYDHHCPWINNCVGQKNIKLFRVYITVQFLDYLYTLTLATMEIFWDGQENSFFLPVYPSISEYVSMALVVYAVCALVFVAPIVYIQYTNVLKKVSTSQRFSKFDENSRSWLKSSSRLTSVSDTYSILLREESAWTPLGVEYESVNSVLDSSLRINSTNVRRCCCFKWKRVSRRSSNSILE